MTEEGREPARELGRLENLDELFNALHGVGDVDFDLKCTVLAIIYDSKAGRPKSMPAAFYAELVVNETQRILSAAIRNKPDVARAVLDRWRHEVNAEYERREQERQG